MNKLKEIALIALKVLLGLVFIVSAVLKVFDMDRFEIYVYSYHFFSLNFSFLVARAAIIVELVLGIGLVSNTLHKFYWWGSMAMLLGYTLLLIYALHIGRTDSCHCFGDFLQFNPKQSLVKNGALMLLFLLVYKVKEWKTPFRWLIFSLALLASTITVFAVSPPDNFTPAYQSENNLHEDLFDNLLNEPPLDDLNLQEGKQVIGIFSTGCEFCQMAAQKLSLMQQFYGFPAENITYVFMGSEEGIAKFYEKSQSDRYRDVLYEDAIKLLIVNDGQFPTIVFMEDGEVVHEYGFRDMKEAEIKAFFTQP
jgi:thiol-disulfide isomerase/thioredoxin